MGTLEKRLKKFNRKPIPNDITFDDIEVIATYYGCIIDSGGKHGKKIVYPPLGRVIPIPMHGKCIKEAYIKELKELFSEIEEARKNQ